MFSKKPSYKPTCSSLLWVVLIVSALLILKKYVTYYASWNMPHKKWGLFVGFGIILFGLVTAWFRKKSDHVV